MTNKKNPENILKYSRKKPKDFKSIYIVLDYSKPKIFFIGQPWWPAFHETLPPPFPTILVLLRPCNNKKLVTHKYYQNCYLMNYFVYISNKRKIW